MTKFRESVWSEIGRYFGYPTCCIKWFETRTDYTLEAIQQKVHNNKGFIPCPECANKINKDFKIEDLITNRICKTPYPNDNGQTRDLNNYLISKGWE